MAAMKTIGDTLGDRLRLAREAAGLTQSALARQLGVRPQSVNQWESGARSPSRENIVSLATITNAPMEWLLAGGALPERDELGRFISPIDRGMMVPMLRIVDAIARLEPSPDAPKIHAYFPCGPRSYFFPLTNDSCAPDYPEGSVWINDPDVSPRPGDMVLATYGDNREPVVGKLRYETNSTGQVTIIDPINPNWPAARSDLGAIEIISVMVSSHRGRR